MKKSQLKQLIKEVLDENIRPKRKTGDIIKSVVHDITILGITTIDGNIHYKISGSAHGVDVSGFIPVSLADKIWRM